MTLERHSQVKHAEDSELTAQLKSLTWRHVWESHDEDAT